MSFHKDMANFPNTANMLNNNHCQFVYCVIFTFLRKVCAPPGMCVEKVWNLLLPTAVDGPADSILPFVVLTDVLGLD